jgi:hypothetical protein
MIPFPSSSLHRVIAAARHDGNAAMFRITGLGIIAVFVIYRSSTGR